MVDQVADPEVILTDAQIDALADLLLSLPF